MKGLLLIAALCAAPLVHAQSNYPYQDPDDEDVVAPLQDELERLRSDRGVIEFAPDELARAEDYIEDLANESPDQVEAADVEQAVRLLARAERAARKRSPLPGREVIVLDDPQSREEARQARGDADSARLAADEEREHALAARMEAEQERAENARLRAELGQAQTRVTERGVVLTLGDVLFEVGKSDLKPGATRSLDKLVAALRRDPEMAVTIEGHTDSTGKRASNVELSKRRANAVRSYLAAKGVGGQRIKAAGLGPDFPVATNATAEGRQRNRRVELLVQNDGFDE